MQLAGELAKVNLASLIRLVRNGELTGKVCLTQGVNTAFIFFEDGNPIHVESDIGEGKDALLELFLWQSGTFSYIECDVSDSPYSLEDEEPLENLLKEGLSYQEARRYLEQLRVNFRTVFKAIVPDNNNKLLAAMDGKTPLGDIVARLKLTRREYIPQLKHIVAEGQALVIETPNGSEQISLPEWVISRLKQDNPDPSQAIVDLVIWTDRIKCWLYQADADFARLIGDLEGGATKKDGSTTFGGDKTAIDSANQSFIPSPTDPDSMLPPSGNDAATTVDRSSKKEQAANKPRQPGFEF